MGEIIGTVLMAAVLVMMVYVTWDDIRKGRYDGD